jgi:hypothetical protein
MSVLDRRPGQGALPDSEEALHRAVHGLFTSYCYEGAAKGNNTVKRLIKTQGTLVVRALLLF